MSRERVGWVGLLLLATGCGSSSGAAPIDPVATAYCAACSELTTCERVVNETINANCTDETRAWYSCATENACDSTACEAEWVQREVCMGESPADKVFDRIRLLGPSANLGHRGTGPTRAGHPFPENSISSFLAALDAGANGVSLDVEITLDGKLIVMHDDTLDRTTNCTGCVSAMTFDEVRACRLLDGDGAVTQQQPPRLLEVYSAIAENAIMDVELKVYDSECLTDTTGPEQLVAAALDEVTLIGGEARTIFSSFDETVVELVKQARPGYYSALLSSDPGPELVETALSLNQDAIHP
ncbi:MAG: glycerophosphodiester phosphodiesterase family protein, partial [Deltaproteobacteria bacterium]|nr:glycerophosphodiester phosphodiesterase family protein [Deltaproteobacteria bacterium]